ncbi:hypothetical protein [Gracilimonas amylolytica]|uniref:hypothetical protein n=1 Tax=Gracilimonas amylolytica TaxID=1749045 RepID=UPI000CD8520D|nr:hypothetical protein [Gracilimonas amylolytica]
MKKRNIPFLILSGFMLFATPTVNAAIYQCDNGDCVTTINDGDGFDGFTWSISCSDGSWDYGEVAGASYGGSCPMISQ